MRRVTIHVHKCILAQVTRSLCTFCVYNDAKITTGSVQVLLTPTTTIDIQACTGRAPDIVKPNFNPRKLQFHDQHILQVVFAIFCLMTRRVS